MLDAKEGDTGMEDGRRGGRKKQRDKDFSIASVPILFLSTC